MFHQDVKVKAMQHFEFKKINSLIIGRMRGLFPDHIASHLKELYCCMALLNFAFAALLLFEPIYLYTLGFPVTKILLYFAGVYTLYFFIAPLGGMYAKYKGFEHGIIAGSLFLILYLVSLMSVSLHWSFLFIAMFALALQKSFFWPAYHADFAYFSESGERGREISIIVIIDTFAWVLGPLVGGLLATLFGFPAMFALMCLIILCSNIPFLFKREEFTSSQFEYRTPFRYLTSKEARPYVFGYLGFAEELIVFVLWPIFMFVTLDNVLETAGIAATSTLVTACVVLYVGTVIDTHERNKAMKLGIILVSLSWIFRLIARGGYTLLFLDFFGRVSRNSFMMPLISGLYDFASKNNAIVKNVLLMEMSLSIGKVAIALVLAAFFYFFGEQWNVVFIIAAACSLLYFFLARKHHVT